MDSQAIKTEEEASFHERADSFELSVILSVEQRLIITMKDFVHCIIYQKDYTKEDIGKEINRKMDLMDVYNAFAQTQCQKQKTQQKQEKDNGIKKYEFGTVVQNQNGKLPCYKIENGGKITVYSNYLDIIKNKKITCESQLILKKVRNMTKAEIQTGRQKNEKKIIQEDLKKEIQREKKKRQELVKIVIKLSHRYQKQLRLMRQSLASNHKLEIKINSAQEEQAALNWQLRQELNLVREELKSTRQQLVNVVKSKKSELNNKINEPKEQSGQIKFFVPNAIKNMMALSQAYSNQFRVNGLSVQYSSSDETITQFIFNLPIGHNQTAKFRIKITKTRYSQIMVGVVDYIKQKDRRCSWNSGNAMCYYGKKGKKYPQNLKVGDGFKQGDVVEVDVNRATSTIKYIINGALKATHINNMLADKFRLFMPYVDMFNTNDCVEWLL